MGLPPKNGFGLGLKGATKTRIGSLKDPLQEGDGTRRSNLCLVAPSHPVP